MNSDLPIRSTSLRALDKAEAHQLASMFLGKTHVPDSNFNLPRSCAPAIPETGAGIK